MSQLKVLSANFTYNSISISNGSLFIDNKTLDFNDVSTIEFATESNTKKARGAIGLGAVGGLTFGPVGAIAGLLLGGNKKETNFVVELKDGKMFIASTTPDIFLKIQKSFNEHLEFIATMVEKYAKEVGVSIDEASKAVAAIIKDNRI